MFIKSLVFSFCFLFATLAYSDIQKVKQKSVDSCIEIWMNKHTNDDETEWFIYVGNKCRDTRKFGYNIKIIKAYNVSVDKGTILETKHLIVPARDRKLVFIASKKVLTKPNLLSWVLVK